MASVSLTFRGTTPRQLASRIKRLPRQIEQRMIEQPAKRLAGRGRNGLLKTTSREVRRGLAAPAKMIESPRMMSVKAIRKGRGHWIVRLILRARMIPISAFRPHYSAGREAGRGDRYGRGTAYTMYRGRRERAEHVFEKPSQVGRKKVFWQRDPVENPAARIRAWRGIALANYFRNEEGRGELPALKRSWIDAFKGEIRRASTRVFGSR